MDKIKLGTRVTDAITGFTGTAIARIEYLNGCVSYEVRPDSKGGTEMVESAWIDAQQLGQTDVSTGGPGATPPPFSTPDR